LNYYVTVPVGLQIKKGKKKAASAGHLTWISKCIGLDPAVYLGLTSISRNKVGDYRAVLAVEACIKWFTDKLPTDLEEDLLISHVDAMIQIFSSTNQSSVRKACTLLFKDKMGLDLKVSQESQVTSLDDPQNNSTKIDGDEDIARRATIKRSPSKQQMFVLGKSAATKIQSNIDYAEITLFARGLNGYKKHRTIHLDLH
jgi:hypothetical protein